MSDDEVEKSLEILIRGLLNTDIGGQLRIYLEASPQTEIIKKLLAEGKS